ncbi:MAG: hypothetical protein PHR35_11715, partial [Kiritimatiellae bacterium]|nr:hypothetical protein [Kiritimatiellia bacterium]
MSSKYDFYVAPNGNDACSGTRPKPGKDGPFVTLRRARDAVRALKAGGRLRGPVTIAVRGGVYRLSEPLVFTAEDSGTDDAGITYAAYEDEPVTISGGSLVGGWRPTASGLWSATVETAGMPWTQLFVNGRRAQRARMPLQGYYYVEGALPDHEHPPVFRYQPGDLKSEWAE